MIRQGDVYWVDLGPPSGSGPGYLHPHVVVQNDLFNHSRLRTVVVGALTSNLALSEAPGNVLLDDGEASLPKRSVVNVTRLFTVDKTALDEKIGSLAPLRVREILSGIDLLLEPREAPEDTDSPPEWCGVRWAGVRLPRDLGGTAVGRDALNAASPAVVVVPCTRHREERRLYPSQVLLRAPDGGLRSESTALGEQVRALSKRRLVERWRAGDPRTLERLERALQITLDLPGAAAL